MSKVNYFFQHKKIKPPKKKALFIFLKKSNKVLYSAEIASEGQTLAQEPQDVQIVGSITKISPSEIAPTGHSPMQVPQATQSSEIT